MSCYTIHDLPCEDRPRERLMAYGADGMATAELIAIILGSGMRGKSVLQLSQELLTQFGSLSQLAEASLAELCQVKGMGQAKAVQLKAAISLGLRTGREPRPPRLQIEHPKQAYELLRSGMENETRECVVAALLDARSRLIRTEQISVGTLTESLLEPRNLFLPAIRHQAASIILAHNHPSGDPSPSPDDIRITKSLIEAGKLMEIPVQDHLIIGHGRFVSLRQRGLWA